MSDGKFFHIFLQTRIDVTQKQVDDLMNQSVDWFRYDSSNWVVYSMSDADALWDQFKSLVEPNGTMFVCELKTQNSNGWMPASLWKWLKKNC